MDQLQEETTEGLVERRVTYTLEMDGKLYIVENVPARVDEETGEQFFSPHTVERLQKIVLNEGRPDRIAAATVYEHSE